MFLETEHIYYDSSFFNPMCVIANSVNIPLVIKVDEVTVVCGLKAPRRRRVRGEATEDRDARPGPELVEWTKYPPVGDRAIFLGGNADFKDRDLVDYMKEANGSTLIFAHIETAKGVENVDEILSDEDVDVRDRRAVPTSRSRSASPGSSSTRRWRRRRTRSSKRARATGWHRAPYVDPRGCGVLDRPRDAMHGVLHGRLALWECARRRRRNG